MGRMNELSFAHEEARPIAFKLLMEVRFDLEAAFGLALSRIRDGSIEMSSGILRDVIMQVHAEGEPLKGIAVLIPEPRLRDVG